MILQRSGVSGPKWNFVMSKCGTFVSHSVLTLTWFSNYDEAIRVMQRATAVPKNTKVNYHDHVCPSVP